jgi:hypothetical protein
LCSAARGEGYSSVECFGPELKPYLFFDGRVLEQGEVEVGQRRSADIGKGTRDVTVSKRRRNDKRARIAGKNRLTPQVGHEIDIMATCLDIAGANYPATYEDRSIIPLEGKTVLPILGKAAPGAR